MGKGSELMWHILPRRRRGPARSGLRAARHVLAAAVCTAPMLFSASGQAAAASSSIPVAPALSVPIPTVNGCATVLKDLASYASAGIPAVGCVSSGPNAAAPAQPATTAPSAPSYCASNSDYYQRFGNCLSEDWWYDIYNTSTGAIEGYGSGTMTFWNQLSYNNRGWDMEGDLNINTFSGLAVGTTINAAFVCNSTGADCGVTPVDTSWGPQTEFVPANDNANYAGGQSFQSSGTGTDYQNFEVYMTFENPNVTASFLTIGPTSGGATQRCDNFSYFNNSAGGCVFYQYPYNFFNISLSDPTVYQAAEVDEIGQQTISTHPGLYGSGAPLTRDTNPADQQANRAVACKNVPPSCDEYPYASTHQGAAFGPYYSQTILASQNSQEGTNLGVFLYYNRIAEGDPYFVNVTN